jgi:hypothetical protein
MNFFIGDVITDGSKKIIFNVPILKEPFQGMVKEQKMAKSFS